MDANVDFVQEPPKTALMQMSHASQPICVAPPVLDRPIKIYTFLWNSGDSTIPIKIDPWALTLNDAILRKKLENYCYLNCKLHLQFDITGTRFHYGRYMISYEHRNGAFAPDYNYMGTLSSPITRSQMPTILLDPCMSNTQTMDLAIVHPHGTIDLNAGNGAQIGVLWLAPLNALAMANAAAAEPVRITIYASLIDTTLSGSTLAPLSNFSAQSDEYAANQGSKPGIISRPAFALANFVSMFKIFPPLRPFALATQIGASAVGSIAQIFGMSQPASIVPPGPTRHVSYQSFSHVTGTDSSKKLTIDPKHETTISPDSLGLQSEDELSLGVLSKKWSFVQSVAWPVTSATGTSLLRVPVYPTAVNRTAVTSVDLRSGYSIIPTALNFVSFPFRYWTGSLEYHIQVVCSAAQRGRLRIVYDPNGTAPTGPLNATHNVIVDTAVTKDVCFEIGWCQPYQYGELVQLPTSSGHVNYRTNGCFFLIVEDELSSMLITQGAYINIFVRGGSDLQLNQHSPGYVGESDAEYRGVPNFSYTAQSDESNSSTVADPKCPALPVMLTHGASTKGLDLLFFGESVQSFRALLKKSYYYRSLSVYAFSTATRSVLIYYPPLYPSELGLGPTGSGIDRADGYAENYTFAGYTLAAYLRPNYLGWRGTHRWKFVPYFDDFPAGDATGAVSTHLTRVQTLESTRFLPEGLDGSEDASSGGPTFYRLMDVDYNERVQGEAIFYPSRGEPIEWEVPDYIKVRYHCGRQGNGAQDTFTGSCLRVLVKDLPSLTLGQAGELYHSTGEDFTLFNFIAARPIFTYALPAAPEV
jgi:hypothetical protein